MEKMKKELFNTAMKGDWKRVEATYRADTRAHTAKITRSGETALHVAVSDWQEGVVEDIVRHVAEAGTATAALRTENERGNTALHLAAAMGNVRMCRCIAGADASLVGARNCDSETPLFLAALRGKKEAFLALHFMSPSSSRNDASFCRRKDGQTALHCSIAGEYFDLAFHIIQLYGELVNSVDQHGHTPLHVLASKPFAFKSGSNLGRCQRIIYHCTFVDELEVEKDDPTQMMKKLKQEEESANYPPTYKICVNLFQLLRRSVIAVTLRARTPQIGADTENPSSEQPSKPQNLFPPNYSTCFNFFKIVCKALLVILGFGSGMIMKIRQKKEKHVWSVQVMNELLKRASMYEYENTGADPWAVQSTRSHKEDGETNPYEIVNRSDPTFPADQPFTEATNSSKTGNNGTVTGSNKAWLGEETKESAILIAAKNGVKEMVERILEMFPVAIHDVNWQKKNVVLLAVEHRQPHVFRSLLRRNILTDNIFQQVDSHGNSALHLAAMLGDYKPWLIPGSALQMQWEIKWYEFVKKSMPPNFFVRYNDERKTAKEIFTETHAGMVKAGGEWLTHTSESCSVVAALIATVAFATSTTFPGGTDDSSGRPKLEDRPAFELFAIASLVALCFSVTAVIMFLAILTSRYQEKDFGRDLPRKLLIGLTSLFVSIASMLVSFCAGHFFVLHHKLKYAAFPMYAVTCLPVSFFALAQFPLYFDLIWASFKKVPQRSYKVALSAP